MLRETHQDFVVRSSDFRVEKSAWERPLWIFVSQNNFISGTDVDSVDKYVFVLYSNGIFNIHYLSLERIVCYSIRQVSLSSVKSPKNGLHYDNNFISGTGVDSVDKYVFVLYSNGIFILHYLSLERIVCYSIRLVSLSSVKLPKNGLHYELS